MKIPAGRAAQALDNPHAEQAIEWMVLFRSGEATPEDYRRFTAWSAADPANASAWERMQDMLKRSFAPVREVEARAPGQVEAVERIVLRPPASPARRKALRGVMALGAVGVATGLLASRNWPLAALGADLRTATGERREFDLPDGSSLMLNARSAVQLDFSDGLRRVRLLQGELVATVAADAARPFVVETAHGTARALGTRFLVRREPERTLAVVLEHSIRVGNGASQEVLQQGQGAYIDAHGISRVADDLRTRAAWTHGMLVANDEALADVIDALRAYRRGYIRISPAAARLRVLGAFPLDDTDNVLRSLEQTMPLKLSHFGGVLVAIDVK